MKNGLQVAYITHLLAPNDSDPALGTPNGSDLPVRGPDLRDPMSNHWTPAPYYGDFHTGHRRPRAPGAGWPPLPAAPRNAAPPRLSTRPRSSAASPALQPEALTKPVADLVGQVIHA